MKRSTIASYIERFRGPPTSREERERTKEASSKDFWWIDQDKSSVSSERPQILIENECFSIDDDENSEPPSPPKSPVVQEKALEELKEEEMVMEDHREDEEESFEYWDALSPLSSPKEEMKADAVEALDVDSSSDSIDLQWYMKPDEALIEDPEVTIKRLRQRLGLNNFDEEEWKPLESKEAKEEWWNGDSFELKEIEESSMEMPMEKNLWTERFNDDLHETDSYQSASFLADGNQSSFRFHGETVDIESIFCDLGNSQAIDATEQEENVLQLPSHTEDPISPRETPQCVATTQSDLVVPTVDLVPPSDITPLSTPPTPKALTPPKVMAPSISPRNVTPLSIIPPSSGEGLQSSVDDEKQSSLTPTRRGIAFRRVSQPTTVLENTPLNSSENDEVELATVVDDLLSQVVSSWTDSSSLESKPEPSFALPFEDVPNDPPRMPMEDAASVPTLEQSFLTSQDFNETSEQIDDSEAQSSTAISRTESPEMTSPHITDATFKDVSEKDSRSDDIVTLKPKPDFDDDPMEDIDKFIDDDVVRTLVHRILVCEEALAILKAREMMAKFGLKST